MVTTGDVWDFSPVPMTVTITKSANDTGDDGSIMEFVQGPKAPVPPVHVHPTQEESYEVVAGTMIVTVNGEEHTLGPGETYTVSPMTAHTYRVDGDDELRFRIEIRPGDRFETYMETVWRMASIGGVSKPNSPGALLRFAVVVDAFPDVLIPASRPQRAVMKAFAFCGRVLGYPASYS